MAIYTAELEWGTEGDGHVLDITADVQGVVGDAGVGAGQATAFVRGSTAAITTMEFEPGGVHDLGTMLERLIPASGEYEHNRLNHDTNAHAHLRAAMIGPSETIPVVDGRLALGTWQQVVAINLDNRARERELVAVLVG